MLCYLIALQDTLVSLIRSLGVNIDNDQRKRLDDKVKQIGILEAIQIDLHK